MSPAPKTVDDYLAALPEDVRATLEDLRQTIRAAAPDATEVVSYQVPTFKYRGSLVAFGAAKTHCAFYVMSPLVLEAHGDELAAFDTAKGTIRFAAGEPLPAALVTRIVKARIAENEAARSR